ncbi:hypothetical protein ACFOU2_16935 [Bacillus songklensis]|uniref:HTH lacI-type domain-containing protein n=1 Tax=Bacillus songklensis TaxID=1069116 RepID=A0ABV8B6P1_9BACI
MIKDIAKIAGVSATTVSRASKGCNKLGSNVPNNVSVVGYDNITLASYFFTKSDNGWTRSI